MNFQVERRLFTSFILPSLNALQIRNSFVITIKTDIAPTTLQRVGNLAHLLSLVLLEIYKVDPIKIKSERKMGITKGMLNKHM